MVDAPNRDPATWPAPLLAPVLLVEDDDVHARLVEASLALARLSNPVVRARTGEEAIAYLQGANDASGSRPALVLLDLELPGQSGLDVLGALIKMSGAVASCPVIMMTGSSDGASITRARDLGVRSYLVKPVAFDALADVIHRLGLRWALLTSDR